MNGTPWRSDAFKALSYNLLGKNLKGVLPETMVMNERLMYHMNMGFYVPQTQNPHSSVAFHASEHKFYHPWSNHSFARSYGYNRIKEIMPLKDYMTMPAYQVDEWIDGLVDGETARLEQEKAKDNNTLTDIERQQKALAEQLGLGNKL